MPLKELAQLRQDAAGLLEALEQAEWRRAAGLPREGSLAATLGAHPRISSPDGLAEAREALADAVERKRGAARIARLASLVEFAARVRALALEPGAAEELWDLPARPTVRPPGDAGAQGARTMVEVARELPLLRSREERAELERALSTAAAAEAGARSAAWDAAQDALGELGLGDPGPAAAALQARGWAPAEGDPAAAVEAVCERALRETDAIAQDLGGWLLERNTGARRYPGGAERHDVLHLLHAPRCAGAFPRGEMLRTCRRWAEMLRLDLEAGGAVSLDDDERPLKPAGSRAVAIDPPVEVRVAVFPQEGPRALSALLSALAVAQLRAGPPADAPPEDLWLGDAAVPFACGGLFAGLAADPLWLRRCARADLSRDDERTLAYARVLDARVAAARALASLSAHRVSLGAKAEAAARELYARAAGADLPPGFALRELDPWLSSWAELRGYAFAARLRASLRERFDEDYWRNPRTLPALQGLFGRGGRPTLAELWAERGGTPSIEPLLAELVELCR